MKKSLKFEPITREEILNLFAQLDTKLKQKISIVTIGGVSLILQEFLDRVTRDKEKN